MKKNIFSGIQPSGILTIGNYIGALKQWKDMQENFFCIYCIVDLHALTIINNHHINLNKNILDTLALLLSCGINPNKSIIFTQSDIPEHTQLYWILSCFIYYNELNRMTQFKNKYKNHKNKINCGIFTYPILMAADILLYNTDFVPVGEDQKQHLELSQKIAKRFNDLTLNNNFFKIPKPIILEFGSRIMALKEPTKKMSKSDHNKDNIISLLDDPKLVFKKIKNAVTDSDNPPIIKYDLIKKIGISNLLSILSSLNNISIFDLEKNFIGKMYSDLKNQTADSICKFLLNLQNQYYEYRKDEKYLKKILKEGAYKAKKYAKKTIEQVYELIKN